MSNRVRLRITGLDELRQAIRAYGAQLVEASVDAVSDAVEDTVLKARFLAPVGTYPAGAKRKGGRLRESIRGSVRADVYGARGTVRATAPHAGLIEFGTVKMKAKPFLVPTAIRNRRRMNAALAKAVQDLAPDGLGRPTLTGEGPAMPRLGLD